VQIKRAEIMDSMRAELISKRTVMGRKWPLEVAVIFFGIVFCLSASPVLAATNFYVDPISVSNS